ncbi:uncharacterized protein LOC130709206 [Balaenoptera acutorostrata]|uniref:Uncharacterized protein LOC130709206 n=1 Tax=Balaenoptera acutorostrata TaxID=9767 RepID=A0ABM3UDR6_BALAC|nr:uncharacterized protein LOC130709206 [Balaenoptera acutorostrata]
MRGNSTCVMGVQVGREADRFRCMEFRKCGGRGLEDVRTRPRSWPLALIGWSPGAEGAVLRTPDYARLRLVPSPGLEVSLAGRLERKGRCCPGWSHVVPHLGLSVSATVGGRHCCSCLTEEDAEAQGDEAGAQVHAPGRCGPWLQPRSARRSGLQAVKHRSPSKASPGGFPRHLENPEPSLRGPRGATPPLPSCCSRLHASHRPSGTVPAPRQLLPPRSIGCCCPLGQEYPALRHDHLAPRPQAWDCSSSLCRGPLQSCAPAQGGAEDVSLHRGPHSPEDKQKWPQGTGGGSEARIYSNCVCGCGQQRPTFQSRSEPLTNSLQP